jgi:hypothetical protein
MRKVILVSLLAGALGVAAGFGLGIFVYPFWFLTDVAMETVANRDAKTVVADGRFIHADPKDPVHWGRGGVSILAGQNGERLVELNSDFAVGPGPRFHVYLVDRAEVKSSADFRASKTVDLGRLRAFQGSQVYAVPASVDLAQVHSVVIWCKEFHVLISPARLKRAAVAAASG